MIKRRKTRTVKVGNVKIGSEYPIVIQSMTKTDTHDIELTTRQILEMEEAGCELIRVAVKNREDAKAIEDIKKNIRIPIAADIHFDHELAIEAIRRGADKIRINPGNIKSAEHISQIIDLASEKNVPIRIGINSGSLEELNTSFDSPADIMVRALLNYLEIFKRKSFQDIIISVKSSDVVSTCEAYKKIAPECDYPLHLGITATGLAADGIVKSSIGIGALLLSGIGDTIRVSLTDSGFLEIETAKRILAAAGMRHFGPEIIACPTCGRCEVDLISIAKELEEKFKKQFPAAKEYKKPFIVAIMGCVVNGPGEAKNADIGIAFGKNKGVIFRAGKIMETVEASRAVERLMKFVCRM